MGKKHKGHDHEEHMDESWLIPYADLLTLLLALFIVLFASSQVDQNKFQDIKMSFRSALEGGPSFFDNMNPMSSESAVNESVRSQKTTGPDGENLDEKGQTEEAHLKAEALKKQEETMQLTALKQKLDAYIRENGLNAQLETVLDEQQLRITISDNTLFASGSAVLKKDSLKIAATISTMLEQYPSFEVVVSGHTDDQPIKTAQFASNFHLSTARALNFMTVILQNPNVSPQRFWSAGYGEYRPVTTNTTVEGRAINRRVEVSILRNVK